MGITIKTQQEIEKMRIAGKLASDVLEMITPHVKAGVTTNELNTLCAEYTDKVQNAISAPLNYHGFPKSICTSLSSRVLARPRFTIGSIVKHIPSTILSLSLFL